MSDTFVWGSAFPADRHYVQFCLSRHGYGNPDGCDLGTLRLQGLSRPKAEWVWRAAVGAGKLCCRHRSPGLCLSSAPSLEVCRGHRTEQGAQLWQQLKGAASWPAAHRRGALSTSLLPVLGSSLLATKKGEINIHISFMPVEFWKAIWFQEI